MTNAPGQCRARARTAERSRGFTLVELLVALTLLGLISVVLFGGLQFGSRAWEAGDARAEQLGEIEALQGLLRRQLSRAFIPVGVGDRFGSSAPFVGEPDRLRWVGAVPAHIGVGGLYWMELAVVDDLDGQRLDFAWALYRPDDPEALDALPEEGETVVGGRRTLVEGLSEAGFAYYGFEPDGGRPDWQDRWGGEDGLPSLFALRLEYPEGDARIWPLLVVRPQLVAVEAEP